MCAQLALRCSLMAVLPILFSAFPYTQSSAATYLTGEEIREVLSGNTIESPTGSWRVYFDPSGENRAQEGDITDRGDWEVFDDHYCARWDNWVDGKRLCWKMQWKAKGKSLKRKGIKGAKDSEVILLKGNPAGL